MEHKGTIRIETDRLVLKRHVLDDAEIMFKNWVTEKDVTKFLSWQPHKNVDETKQLLIDWIESYDKQDFYFWTIELKDSHELVGDISVVSLDEATESVEPAWYWKQMVGKRYNCRSRKGIGKILLKK